MFPGPRLVLRTHGFFWNRSGWKIHPRSELEDKLAGKTAARTVICVAACVAAEPTNSRAADPRGEDG